MDTIELRYLQITDYSALRALMEEAYPNLPDAPWERRQVEKLIELFPRGQVVVTVNEQLAGCALSIIIDARRLEHDHTYDQITANYTFSTHSPKGDALYGVDIFVRSQYRGMRLGRRLYDYRKELCEELNLKGIVFGGRLPNYHQYAEQLSPKEYIRKVRLREIEDPVLNFQLSNDFHVKKVLKNYLPGDIESKDYAALLQWDNIYYTAPAKQSQPTSQKQVVRLALVQWQMRTYRCWEELVEQLEYFMDATASYHADFVLFPEYFNAPLMAKYNDLSEADAIRALAEYTERLRELFSQYAVSYNTNIITGSMPEVEEGKLHNVGYLCHRNGKVDKYIKIHVTPDEEKVWGLHGGDFLRAFDTDCGKIGILICYDVEFPELSRILAEQGMNLLFVPFLTDTQTGYSRVRHCAQARAIENECYVAIAGSVGNLPKVHNMDMQFAQSMVFTPCDFAFPTTGVKAEATPNAEMLLIADVDLDLLKELHEFGSVRNLKDRRPDLYRRLRR